MRPKSRACIGVVFAASILGGCGAEGKSAPRPEPNGVSERSASEALALGATVVHEFADATFDLSGNVYFLDGPAKVSGEAVRLATGDCRVELSASGKGTTIDVQVGDRVFHHFDEAAAKLRFDPGVSHVMDETWHAYPDDESDLPDCGLRELLPAKRFWPEFRKGPVEAVGAREALRLDGRNENGAYSVWIATTGDPLVVQSQWRAKKFELTSTLVATDSGTSVSAPMAADVMEWR